MMCLQLGTVSCTCYFDNLGCLTWDFQLRTFFLDSVNLNLGNHPVKANGEGAEH